MRIRMVPIVLLTMAMMNGHVIANTATLQSVVQSASIDDYDDAPLSPDGDDPAIWINKWNLSESLVVTANKNGGGQVLDMNGQAVQFLFPFHRPAVGVDDPPVPGLTPPSAATSTCPGSDPADLIYSRYNNVDVIHGVWFPMLGIRAVAVFADRGCDRLRIFRIDPTDPAGPLVDITDPNAPRVFSDRFPVPSQLQPPASTVPTTNPLADQDTAYGLGGFLDKRGNARVFVSQRNRSRVGEFVLEHTAGGKMSYRMIRDYRFDVAFTIPTDGGGTMTWEPCRETPEEDLQFEGITIDRKNRVVYASQEIVGVWKFRLRNSIPSTVQVVNIKQKHLVERVIDFGLPFAALPDDDEFECTTDIPDPLPPGSIVSGGSQLAKGQFIEKDAEGITWFPTGYKKGFVIASSQGSSMFAVYKRNGKLKKPLKHVINFEVTGVADTDGLEVFAGYINPTFPEGVLVVHNGDAPRNPGSPDVINGFEYDGTTRFEFIDLRDVIDAIEN